MSAGTDRWSRGNPVRLAATVALVYALHFSTNVVRETYLAVAMAEDFSIRVDRFLGLHPDVFEMPGRGAFINNNPGASMLAAIPYGVAHPALEQLYRLKPSLVAPKPPVAYDDPRPNRTRFMNEMRARGLDVRLALAAAVIQLGVNVPLGAFATVAVFLYFRGRLREERPALRLALLFAFGTPVFFRSAFLNQNLLLCYCTLFAWLVLLWPARTTAPSRLEPRRLLLAGLLLGFGLLCDYSALPLLVAFGLWATWRGLTDDGARGALVNGGWFVAGAAGPIAVLCVYQYAAFGNALLPAQSYMPGTEFSAKGWHGVDLPRGNLLWLNLFSPGYGLFLFCPMLVAAVLAPKYRTMPGGLSRQELTLVYGASIALYLFSSSIAFAALQWNTGIRYMMPAVPLLFLALAPVLLHAPGWATAALVVPTVVISWAVSMARESVPVSLVRIATHGPELPWYTALQKTRFVYLPGLPTAGVPLALLLLAAAAMWAIWRPTRRHNTVLDSQAST